MAKVNPFGLNINTETTALARAEKMTDSLVIQAARFGDLIQTRRLIKSLLGKSRVHLCVDEGLCGLARLLYPGAEIHSLYFHGKIDQEKFKLNLKSLTALSAIDFSEIYNCNFSPLAAAVCRLFENEKVTGLRPAGSAINGIERSPWARFAFAMTQRRVLSSLNLEDYWAYFSQSPAAPGDVNPPPKARGEKIGVVCAGRDARRSLSIPALKNIITCLNRIHGGPEFLLIGGLAEAAAAKKLVRALAGERIRLVDLSGKTSFSELIDILLTMRVLITPDTGVMHLAAFLGVPVTAFFLSSAWAWETGPYGEGHFIWQSAPPCAPCLESAPCQRGEKCAEIFESPAFMRIFAQWLAHPEKELEFPKGLMLLQSVFDSAGQILTLARGEDPHEIERRTARCFMKKFLKKDSAPFSDFPSELVGSCGRLFCPPEEWMLPPERYF